METKTETGKSSMNRGRRQLLIGAGLAPMVVTLHSAKVFGQDLPVGNPSGAAPFSGVIEGSVGRDGSPRGQSSEVALYEAIGNDANAKPNGKYTLQEYYGGIGQAKLYSNVTDFVFTKSDWSYDDGMIAWTKSYEQPFVKAVSDFDDGTATIYVAIKERVRLNDDTVLSDDGTNLKNQLPPQHQSSSNLGVYAYVHHAINMRNLAIRKYNDALVKLVADEEENNG